jgi:uncharacterized membrane protein YidH (DUF202 family)
MSERGKEVTWTDLDADALARLRTALAGERTIFAVIRTGLAIAGGGTVIISLLGSRWPAWLQGVLAAGFLVPGYALMLDGLSRFRRVAATTRKLDPDRHRVVSPGLMTTLIAVVQVVVLAVLVLFVFDAFEPEPSR